jgi:ribosome-binding protein aMBF1 (putative translation factor)
MQNHQDWKTVVLSNPKKIAKNQPKEIVKKEEIHKPNSLPSGFKLDENDEIKSIKYVSKDISQIIINARCAKKMSRKDLAKNMNLKEDIITNIETGKAIYNGDQIARIKKFLGI